MSAPERAAPIRMTYGALAEALGAMRHIGGPGRITDPERSQRLYRLMMVTSKHVEDAERVRQMLLQAVQADPSRAPALHRQLEQLMAMEVELGVEPLPATFFDDVPVEPGALYALGPLYEGWERHEGAELPEQLRALVDGIERATPSAGEVNGA